MGCWHQAPTICRDRRRAKALARLVQHLLGRGDGRARVLDSPATAADLDTRACEDSEELHAVMPCLHDQRQPIVDACGEHSRLTAG
jgi:hypothetical protein